MSTKTYTPKGVTDRPLPPRGGTGTVNPGGSQEVAELRRQIRIMQESLERKNKALDAMHYVWCDGGCPSGSGRWTGEELTEEVVEIAERNTKRLRRRFENRQGRMERGAAS